jgi:hypothetical protein
MALFGSRGASCLSDPESPNMAKSPCNVANSSEHARHADGEAMTPLDAARGALPLEGSHWLTPLSELLSKLLGREADGMTRVLQPRPWHARA